MCACCVCEVCEHAVCVCEVCVHAVCVRYVCMLCVRYVCMLCQCVFSEIIKSFEVGMTFVHRTNASDHTEFICSGLQILDEAT